MKFAKQLSAALLAAVTIVGLGACGSGSDSDASSSGASGGQIHIGRTTPFDGFKLDQELLNESYAISASVIEPLIRVGDVGKKLEPGIAKSWEYNADNTQLTIHLTPGVKFSNGKPLTAEDVAFSVDVWKKGPNYGANYASIASTTIKDPQTIVFNLSAPDTSLPAFLCYSVAGVVPKDFAGMSEDAYWQKPIGAGAFSVSKWSTDGDVVLKKNPDYYRKGYPKVDQITNSFVPDVNSVALQLKSNQIDIVNQLDTVVAKSLDQSFIADVPPHQTPTLIFNTTNQYLSNKNVRQAIGYALDYKSILKTGFNGYGTVPSSSLPPNLENSTKASNGYYKQDTAKAKQLLQGVTLPSKPLTLTYSTSLGGQAAVQIVQENLKKIGIPVELKAVDGGTWSGALSDGSFDMILFSTNANSPDLIDAPAYVAGTKMLYSQMDAAKLGQLITSYKATGDTKQKVGIVQQIDDYLTDEAPYLVLSDCKVIDARQTNIKGLNVQPWSTYYYDTLSR